MDDVREDPCEMCERVRRGPDDRPASASQYDDVRMRCECPGRRVSVRERRTVSGECRTESYRSRRMGEYLRSDRAFPTPHYTILYRPFVLCSITQRHIVPLGGTALCTII
jgi:hypothetical protein